MGIIETLISSIFLGFACAYPVCVMLLNFRDGPLTEIGFKVYRHDMDSSDIEASWELNIFDRIRSLFNVYEMYDEVWITKNNNWTKLFSCPYCLSFWLAIPFSVFLAFVSGQYIWFPVIHLIIVTFSVVMNRWGI